APNITNAKLKPLLSFIVNIDASSVTKEDRLTPVPGSGDFSKYQTQ
uniref:Uncharacterized protein n=1 Tax=Amphimedon queenslandica TaxID=400682 RepID=A0A1X7UIY0_AMPQE